MASKFAMAVALLLLEVAMLSTAQADLKQQMSSQAEQDTHQREAAAAAWKIREANQSQEANQSANSATEQVPAYMQHMTSILVCLHFSVFVTGLVGNALVCLSVVRNKSLQTVTNYYIVNLAVADFLVILICLPPTVYWDLTLTWNFGPILCKLVLYLQSISVSVSVMTLTCISIDRWYAICRPLEFSSTKYRAKITICVIWLASMLIASPEAIFLTTESQYEENGVVYSDCTYSWDHSNTKIYQLCITTLLFLAPFVLMSISYSHIVNVLWRNEMSELVEQHSAAVQPPAARSRRREDDEIVRGANSDYGNAPQTSTVLLAGDKHNANTHTTTTTTAAAATSNQRHECSKRFCAAADKNGPPPKLSAPNCQPSGANNNNKRQPPTYNSSSPRLADPLTAAAAATDTRDVLKQDAPKGCAGNELPASRRCSRHAALDAETATEQRSPPESSLAATKTVTDKVIPNQGGKSSRGQPATATATTRQPGEGELDDDIGEGRAECQAAAAAKKEIEDQIRRDGLSSSPDSEPLRRHEAEVGVEVAVGCCGRNLRAIGGLVAGSRHKAAKQRGNEISFGAPTTSKDRDRGAMSKKYRRNLANYAARRQQYQPQPQPQSQSRPSTGPHKLAAKPLLPAAEPVGQQNNGRLSGHQNNLQPPPMMPNQRSVQVQAPAPTNYLSSASSSNNARFYKLIESRKKAAKMLIVIVIMFGLCYLPVHFLNTLRNTIGLPQNNVTQIASLVSHWLCYFNSAINPLIYNFMSGKFRKEFADLFFCRCFRRQN